MRRGAPLGLILAALTVPSLALAGLMLPSVAQAAGLAVIPFPGTPDASASTQVIFSSLRVRQIRAVEVTGSRSGRHTGHLSALPDGAGTAFVPERPFRPGERVTIAARLASAAAATKAGQPRSNTVRFSFGIGQPVGLDRTAGDRSGSGGPRPTGSGPSLSFLSAPGLHPPAYRMAGRPDQSSGDIFLSPTGSPYQGPMILDNRGRLVWFDQLRRWEAVNLQLQHYRGRPVLTWFRGSIFDGTNVIMDRSYHQLAAVAAGNGYPTDLHEFQITRQNTALVDSYVGEHADLRSVGGPADGTVLDCVIQEIDIPTGRVLWEWHALDHVPVSDSYVAKPNSWGLYDFFHLNSIQQLPGGNLLISARDTWTVYEIDHRTGRILWRVGGKHPSFTMGPGTQFEWQHDARLTPQGILTLFDDADTPQEENQSSGKVLRLNTRARTVTLVHRYTHTPSLLAAFAGGVQRLSNHDVFVSWGSSPEFSEYAPGGRQIFDGSFAVGVGSYRAFRFHWTGHPRTRPSLAVKANPGGGSILYMSWNGATQVARWRVLGGRSRSALKPMVTAAWTGFETTISVHQGERYFAVQALNGQGRVIGTSRTLPR